MEERLNKVNLSNCFNKGFREILNLGFAELRSHGVVLKIAKL
jgi:hypothetical protein